MFANHRGFPFKSSQVFVTKRDQRLLFLPDARRAAREWMDFNHFWQMASRIRYSVFRKLRNPQPLEHSNRLTTTTDFRNDARWWDTTITRLDCARVLLSQDGKKTAIKRGSLDRYFSCRCNRHQTIVVEKAQRNASLHVAEAFDNVESRKRRKLNPSEQFYHRNKQYIRCNYFLMKYFLRV